MKKVCIIPARGGSKRIPRKNIRLLQGRPLLAWTIETAVASGLFDEVMVSTEDGEIADIARQQGASVPFLRSMRTASDHASTVDVVVEVLDRYLERGLQFDLVCCLYPTAVLLRPETLQEAFRQLELRPEMDTAMSVQAFRHPIERAFHVSGDGRLLALYPEQQSVRTQDLPQAIYDAGQFYCVRVPAIRRYGCLVGPDSMPILLDTWEAVDLDQEEDWIFLQDLFRVRQAQ